jgi:hypothetical protein
VYVCAQNVVQKREQEGEPQAKGKAKGKGKAEGRGGDAAAGGDRKRKRPGEPTSPGGGGADSKKPRKSTPRAHVFSFSGCLFGQCFVWLI